MSQGCIAKLTQKPPSQLTISEITKAPMSSSRKLFMISNLKIKGSNLCFLAKALGIMKKAHPKAQMCNLFRRGSLTLIKNCKK
jgi:hypothetical protein